MCIRNAYQGLRFEKLREASTRVTWYPIHVSVAVNVLAVTSRYHGTVREISKVTRIKRRLIHNTCQKEDHLYMATCFDSYRSSWGLRTKPLKHRNCSRSLRCTSSEVSQFLFLKMLKLWHYSVAMWIVYFIFKFSSNMLCPYRNILVSKQRSLFDMSNVGPSTHVHEPSSWTSGNVFKTNFVL
jgi:hypothetical protein